jgi:hypothetical protein
MRRGSVLLAREKGAHRGQMLASIGRGLRDEYDTALPLPDRVSDLVRQIAQPTEESGVDADARSPRLTRLKIPRRLGVM